MNSRNCKFWKYLLLFVAVFIIIVYIYEYQGFGEEGMEEEHGNVEQLSSTKQPLEITTETRSTTPKFDDAKFKQFLNQFLETQKKKIIVTYTKVFGDVYWWDTPMNFKFREGDGRPCEVDRCKVVYTKNSVENADAVLFHAADLPPVNELRELRGSYPKQIWIWMTSESPLHYQKEMISFEQYDLIFNWTGTYRMDSTIWTPFYLILPLQSSDEKPDIQRNYAEGKNKMIIAIISNNCSSYRIEFIRKLKQYINVDLYGKCKEEVNPELPECGFGSPECIGLQSQYKFTLSLENAFCKDYVTEKFYLNGLIRGNVPIVLNQGNLTNLRVAPPNSLINILDFKDLASLAKHLTEIASNDKKYNKYHAWRENYKVGTQNRMCTTCKELWKEDLSKNRPKIERAENNITKPGQYWSFEENCTPYNDEIFQKYLR